MSNLHDDAKNNKPVDIVAAFNWTTFDIIGDLSFGESFHNLELRRPHDWIVTLFGTIRLAVIAMQLATIPGVLPILRALQKFSQKDGSFNFEPYTLKLIEKRMKLGASRPDFMTRVIENNRDDGTGITRDEMVATMALLVIAGSETTATLLSGCIYLLLRNPDKLKKLREELLAEFKSVNDITILRVNRLPYLFAVIEESLRVYPPVPVSLPRVVPPEGASISGYWVPGGVGYSSIYFKALTFQDGRWRFTTCSAPFPTKLCSAGRLLAGTVASE
jgi:cytochrome P450